MRRCTALLVLCLCTRAIAQDDLQSKVFRARDRALPALVNVQPVLDVFRQGRRRQGTATGSGVIVRADGLVVTNFHVAGHAKKIFCTLADKTRVPAKLLGGDPATDLAVLRLDMAAVKRLGASFGVAELGSETQVQVGEFVIALGSPRGLSMSLTKGVVSNTQRYFGGDITLPTGELTGMYNNWIQTDAAINPGNSGGPLVNLKGQVIGINSRGIPGGTGLGFAIPADVVKHVYEQIVRVGRVQRSWIGLDRGLEPLSFDAGVRGVRVGHVAADSPAQTAGITPGDIIVSIGGQRVEAMFLDHIPSIRRIIAESEVGAPLRIEFVRGGEKNMVKVETQELKALKAEQFAARRLGFTARVISERYARRNGLHSTAGVLLTGVAPGGPAAATGLRTGDIVLQLDRKPVKDLASFRALYRNAIDAGRSSILLSVQRGGATMLRVLTPSKTDPEDDE